MNEKLNLGDNVRQILYSMIPFIYLGLHSIYLAKENMPDNFAKFGGVIVLWSLVNMTISRQRYATTIELWNRNLIWTHLNYLQEKEELREEALTTTFDLHAAQIAQLSYHLGKPNPFVSSESKEIKEFCNDVNRKFREQDLFFEKQKASSDKYQEFTAEHNATTSSLKSWENLVWKIEIGLACWGTLQNAYGADFVKLIHNASTS